MDIVLQHIKAHQIDKQKDPKKVKELLKNKHILGNSIADRLAFYKRFENFKVDIK
jgi:hypothetical protein